MSDTKREPFTTGFMLSFGNSTTNLSSEHRIPFNGSSGEGSTFLSSVTKVAILLVRRGKQPLHGNNTRTIARIANQEQSGDAGDDGRSVTFRSTVDKNENVHQLAIHPFDLNNHS